MPRIELTLVDVWNEVMRHHDNNDEIDLVIMKGLAEKAFEKCAECKSETIMQKKQRWSLPERRPRFKSKQQSTSASTSGKVADSIETSSSICEKTRQRLIHSVTKYVKVSDRYLALCSILLKSRAYHLAHGGSTSLCVPLPVVEVPRTDLGKPIIPLLSGKQSLEHPISVSHQFPFVGIVSHTIMPCRRDSRFDSIQLGLDIVVYEDYNRRMYGSLDEFIEVFRDSFTSWEWNRINNDNFVCDDQRLKEFYLRWAIKEAYTKALGVGMSVEFSSFELRLAGVDDDGGTAGDKGLAALLLKGNTTPSRYRATLHNRKDESANRHRSKEWDLFFLPLTVDDERQECSGCACVCVTTLSDDHSNELNIQWMKFDSLVDWHHNPSS
jgi:phosphopantetheinyl transferase